MHTDRHAYLIEQDLQVTGRGAGDDCRFDHVVPVGPVVRGQATGAGGSHDRYRVSVKARPRVEREGEAGGDGERAQGGGA